MFVYVVVVVLISLSVVDGHSRWKCPSPRDALNPAGAHIAFDNTANKYAACGPNSGQWGFGEVVSLKPGWTTFTWEESIAHTGSPFRLAILDETETARILLLDHIPHNEKASPVPQFENTYVPYKMSVQIPDVKCDKCSIQLLYVMTDKTVKCNTPTCFYNPADAACKGSTDPAAATCAGAPNGNVCVQANECFSSYHSCTDVVITGTKRLDQFTYNQQPFDWPYFNLPPQFYSAEVGGWTNGWLNNIPSNFTTDFKSFAGC